MNTVSPRLSSWLFGVSVFGNAGLLVLGLSFLLDVADAAKIYGVPLDGVAGATYVSAAAVRDIFFGALTLVFASIRDRRNVGPSVLLGTIIPGGDGINVFRNSPSPSNF